ncbi:MAG TPA: hypothetical protein VF473_10525 [Cyclobacteriaceae bacterium]
MQPTEDLLLPTPSIFKKTTIKSLLTDRIKHHHPTFKFLTFATGVYHFQRKRSFRNREIKEALHLVFSAEEQSLRASISSRLNPVHTLTPVYNSGFINPHVDMVAIKYGSNVFPTNNTAYHCDDDHESLVAMIDQGVSDFGTAAIPWFDNRWSDLQTNQLVNCGLDIIAAWDYDKTMLRNEIRIQLRRAKLVARNVRHPVCTELKSKLLTIPGQTSEAYHEIPRLAFELIELYCGCHIIS